MLAKIVMAAALLLAAADAPRFSVVDRIAGPDGGYDYISVDSELQRVYVGREYGVMAVDLATNKVIDKFVAANDVAAVLIIPDTKLMLSTEYDAGSVVLFDRTSGAVKKRIKVGKSPDAALYDASSKLVFVMNADSNDTTIIDVKRGKVVATVPLGGKPEAGVADGKGQVFINIEDTAEIAVLDVKSRTVTTRFKLPGCVEPTGIAYDPGSATLISACHNGVARLVNAGNGASRGAVAIGQNADGAIFDGPHRTVWVPCADGTLSWFRLEMNGKVTAVDSMRTEPGARTAALDPKTGRLYLASGQSTPDDKPVAGSFKILVVAPTPPAT